MLPLPKELCFIANAAREPDEVRDDCEKTLAPKPVPVKGSKTGKTTMEKVKSFYFNYKV